MITFKYVRWRNFLSTGNNFTEIQLDRNNTTLIIGENGAGKTKIMYNANMSYGQIQKYLGFLVSQGFIDKMEMDNEVGSQMVTYQLTESGLKLLQLINNLMEMLGTGEGDKV